MKLTEEQKYDLYCTFVHGSYDPFEYIPAGNKILEVLGYEDRMQYSDDDKLFWTDIQTIKNCTPIKGYTPRKISE